MVPKDELTLAILAGGKGARLGGVDKGALRCEGRTLLERLNDLSVLAGHVLVLGAQDDVVKGRGAPGGLTTALYRATTPWVLAVCCDMPYVGLAAAKGLCAAAGDEDIVCFEASRFLEPFPGLYRAALGQHWRVQLERGEPSMRELIAAARVTRLSLKPFDPTGRTVRSVNTPEDARALSVDLP
jgi:molybdopterin-guanine dinucleotide biosynthesis protein A